MNTYDKKPSKNIQKTSTSQAVKKTNTPNALKQMTRQMGNQAMLTYLEQSKKKKTISNGEPIIPAVKEKFERKSGITLDDVRVHYNSEKPEQIGAEAYAQGNVIFIGTGYKQDLEHEVAHVVQQKQGLVKPISKINGLLLNDSHSLEHDATLQNIQSYEGKKLGHAHGNVIQRKIKVGMWEYPRKNQTLDDAVNLMVLNLPLANVQSLGETRFGFKAVKEQLSVEAYKNHIRDMLESETEYKCQSYVALRSEVCRYISSKVIWPQLPKPVSKFAPILKEKFVPTSGPFEEKMDLEPLYAPSSPIRKKYPVVQDWKKDDGAFNFQIGKSASTYSFGGTGKFMHQAGTYEKHLQDLNELQISQEVNRLLMEGGTSTLKDANTIYALIVGIEGCARSMHNIATAAIFFENFQTIKNAHPDKGLLALMQMYLTFVSEGGAKKSKDYEYNENEWRMVKEHLESNGIDIQNTKAIADHISGIVEHVLSVSNIRNPDALQ